MISIDVVEELVPRVGGPKQIGAFHLRQASFPVNLLDAYSSENITSYWHRLGSCVLASGQCVPVWQFLPIYCGL
jgi:hypothetical protein